MITVPAPWRDTPGPTWQLVAAMLRNQRRDLDKEPPAAVRPKPAQMVALGRRGEFVRQVRATTQVLTTQVLTWPTASRILI
jgi:hypothetical protein